MSVEGELPESRHEVRPQPGSLARVDAVELTAFSGPIPHPEILQQYEAIHPGAARQLFSDFL